MLPHSLSSVMNHTESLARFHHDYSDIFKVVLQNLLPQIILESMSMRKFTLQVTTDMTL